MTDKQRIEEMAREIAHIQKCGVTDNTTLAKYLLEKYQPKLPEDSVVLSREEKQEYEGLAKLLIYDKPIKSRVYEFIKDIKQKARKETAKFWYDKITTALLAMWKGYKLTTEQYNAWIITFNGFAKQFGVEVDG